MYDIRFVEEQLNRTSYIQNRKSGDAMTSEKRQRPSIPRHIAIIMDGNGRWAQKRGLLRMAGHRAGVENMRRILTACVEHGIRYLTIYAFSTENWSRPSAEVEGLMRIFGEFLDRETYNFTSKAFKFATWEV